LRRLGASSILRLVVDFTDRSQRMPSTYAVHTPDSAPALAADGLRQLHGAVGLIPNLAATMAESPALLIGFLRLRELYAQTGFTGGEIQVLSLTAAVENDCAWCVAFHTAMALKEGVARQAIDALRRGEAPADRRLAALSGFARDMVRRRGAVDAAAHEAFLAAGYSPKQALDVVMGMAFSLMANYAAHLTQPAVDDFLQPHVWTR
jgi:AhpD family alkylhydroperoxidase